ncbi:MAG: OmpA family protein, partial [Desulfobacterales bacterium]
KFALQRSKDILRPPETVVLDVQGDTLFARGRASHPWIREARRLVRTISGITQFHEAGLVDTDLQMFENTRVQLEKEFILFRAGHVEIAPGQTEDVRRVIALSQRIWALAGLLEKEIQVEIIGHSDSSGSEESNQKISRQRAEKFRELLMAEGLAADFIATRGMGAQQLLRQETSEQNRAFNRRVTFDIRWRQDAKLDGQ